jgi:hypothetical protein
VLSRPHVVFSMECVLGLIVYHTQVGTSLCLLCYNRRGT